MTPSMKTLLSRHGKKAIMGLLTLFVLTAFCYTAYAATTKSITLNENGKKINVSTHDQTVGDVLKDHNITVQPHDVLTPGADQPLKNGMTIKWLPAIQVELAKSDHTEKVWTTARTVGDFLNQEGIVIGAHDALSPSTDTPLKQDTIIQIKRGFQVSLSVAGKDQKVWTLPMTVKDFLSQQKVTLGSQDKVEPSLSSTIQEGSHILVTRVTTNKKVVKESVDYKVIKRTDSNLTKGNSRVIQNGSKGLREKTYLVTYENGKEVKRDLIKTSISKAPKNKIVEVGTKVVHHSYSSSRSLESSGGVKAMNSTAYTASCRGCSGYTTTGINLNAHPDSKIIAVDPSVIPLGTKVYVSGYGYAVAADTGRAIKGDRIDIYFSSKSEARRWGRRHVSVRIIK